MGAGRDAYGDVFFSLLLPPTTVRLIGARRFQAADSVPPTEAALVALCGDIREREKSMTYLTVFGQNRQGVSRISGVASSMRFKGNERKHSVQVSTM